MNKVSPANVSAQYLHKIQSKIITLENILCAAVLVYKLTLLQIKFTQDAFIVAG